MNIFFQSIVSFIKPYIVEIVQAEVKNLLPTILTAVALDNHSPNIFRTIAQDVENNILTVRTSSAEVSGGK